MNCPTCGAEQRETSRFCARCGTTLPPPVNQQVNEPPAYQSVYQQPGMAPPPVPAPYYNPGYSNPGVQGFIGQERSIGMCILLTLVTCGIYGIVWMYQIGTDLKNVLGRDEPNPGLDIILSLVTCGIWGLVI